MNWLLNSRLAAIAVLTVACLAAYANSFAGVFVFDDVHEIAKNPAMRQLWPPTVPMFQVRDLPTRPVPYYTFAINYAVHGTDPWGYHAVNFTIHLLNAILLFEIIRLTLRFQHIPAHLRVAAVPIALATSLLWVVHPLHTEAVTYIYQRIESLMASFFLLTLYGFIRSATGPHATAWMSMSILACGLGMASKEVMFVAPVIVLAYDWAYVGRHIRSIIEKRWKYYSGLFATWSIVLGTLLTRGDQYGTDHHTPWQHLVTEPGVILHYLRLAFWPDRLCLDIGWPVAETLSEILPGAIVVTSLFALTLYLLYREPRLGFLGVWFFFILAPTSSIVPVPDLAEEYRMYLPLAVISLVLTLGTAQLLHAIPQRWHASVNMLPGVAGLILIASTAALASVTIQRNNLYADRLAIWNDTCRKAPHWPRAWYTLAIGLLEAGEVEEAYQSARRAVELGPRNHQAHLNYGAILVEIGRPTEALEHFAVVEELVPENRELAINRGHALLELGRYDEAETSYRMYAEGNPEDPDGTLSLAAALTALGRHDEAESLCRQIVSRRPELSDGHLNLAAVLLAQDRRAEAIDTCKTALRLAPDNTTIYALMGEAAAGIDPRQAYTAFQRALELDPRSVKAHLGMGRLLASRDPATAVRHFATAVRLDRSNAIAHYNLANAYVSLGQVDQAVAHLQKALVLRPDWPEAEQNLQILQEFLAGQQRNSNSR